MKIYLMSVPCAGKTFFARHHPQYRGCRVVDFSPINKRAEKDAAYADRMAPGSSYFERICSFLKAQTEPVCVLGRYGADELARFEGIVLAAVLPSMQQHRHHSKQRRLAHAQSKWADFQQVEVARSSMLAYVRKHQLQLYGSFEQALRDLLPDHEPGTG